MSLTAPSSSRLQRASDSTWSPPLTVSLHRTRLRPDSNYRLGFSSPHRDSMLTRLSLLFTLPTGAGCSADTAPPSSWRDDQGSGGVSGTMKSTGSPEVRAWLLPNQRLKLAARVD